MIDLIYMTMISSEDLLYECKTQVTFSNIDEIYLDINEVVGALKRRNTLKYQQIIDWIESDIIPRIKVMPEGTPLKL